MIHEVKSFSGQCDNCKETFTSYHEGWSLFVDENAVHDAMDTEDWYTGHGDPEHEGKHYCPACYKNDEEVDDKIIVDESRKKETAPSGTPDPYRELFKKIAKDIIEVREVEEVIAEVKRDYTVTRNK